MFFREGRHHFLKTHGRTMRFGGWLQKQPTKLYQGKDQSGRNVRSFFVCGSTGVSSDGLMRLSYSQVCVISIHPSVHPSLPLLIPPSLPAVPSVCLHVCTNSGIVCEELDDWATEQPTLGNAPPKPFQKITVLVLMTYS